MRPIRFLPFSTNQRLPSGPVTMPFAPAFAVPMGNSVMTPAVVMRPTLLPCFSVNQRWPSGPTVMPVGWLLAFGSGNSVKSPAVVMRPILFPELSVNQSAPSGPATIPSGAADAVGIGNSVMSPLGVILPTRWTISMNQRLPSGPAVMSSGSAALPIGNSLTAWPAMRAGRASTKTARAAAAAVGRRMLWSRGSNYRASRPAGAQGSRKALTRNVAICPRLFGFDGQ